MNLVHLRGQSWLQWGEREGGRNQETSGRTPSPGVLFWQRAPWPSPQAKPAAPQSQCIPWPPCCLQVDILVMAEPSSGRWVHLDTEITNSSGRITYSVPRPRRLGVGVYPVKMVVR